ncbi:MAG: ATP-binding cassette domain-containing protein [Acidimicrobiales bacterium]|nr:ATP-binding cassette domain-containing protein [Acidimicrobiales bacterium]MYB82263.1 ATP-binding cassette domain-containing protein [Acidimicrobiales bacterium]MYI12267.1 ATP-binding cassette domain-containing protein [Acidimicrobiales bacterium]
MTLADIRFVAIAIAVGLIVSVQSEFRLFLTTSAIITAILARSVGFLYSDARMVSLCQVSLAGIGGWTVGWFALHTPVPVELALVLGGTVAVPIGVLVGVPALRLRGVDFAIVTLGLAAAIQITVFNRGFPGERENFLVPRPSIAASELRFLWFTLLVALVLELGLRALRRQAVGTTWAMVGQSERSTAAAGRSIVLTKLTAFAVSAFVAGIAGGLLAMQVGRVSARQLEPIDSLVIFALIVMAGSAAALGAAIAGALSAWIPELLRMLGWSQDIGPLVFAVGAAYVLSQDGDGIAGQWIALASKFRRRPRNSHSSERETLKCRRPDSRDLSLVVRDLTVDYGSVRAVDGVSIDVAPGRIVGLIGANGAGKSSLVDAVTGYLAAAEGTVHLGARPLHSLNAHQRARAGLARTFQRERTPTRLSVHNYLAVAARRHTTMEQRDWLLAQFDLPGSDTPIAQLDSAARRRLELVAALSSVPAAALVDEPAAGLTDAESQLLGSALSRVAGEWGIGLLIIEHDLRLISDVCETIVVLEQGRAIAEGPTAATLASEEVVASYLGMDWQST